MRGQASREWVGSQVGRSTWGRAPRFSQLVPCPNRDLHHPCLPFHGWFFSLQRADTEQAVCTSAGTPALGFNHSAPAKEGGTGALCRLPAFPSAAASTSAQVGSSHAPCRLWLPAPRPRAQTQPLLQPGGKPEPLARDWRRDHQFMTLSREKKVRLQFQALGERIFLFFFSSFPIPKVTWPDYFKHSWLFPHAPAPLAGTGVFSKLG